MVFGIANCRKCSSLATRRFRFHTCPHETPLAFSGFYSSGDAHCSLSYPLASPGFRFAYRLSRDTSCLFRFTLHWRFNAMLFRQNGMVMGCPSRFCVTVASADASADRQRLVHECTDLADSSEQGNTIPFGRKRKSETRQGRNQRKTPALPRECRDAKRNL